MRKHVTQYVCESLICHWQKASHQQPQSLLQTLPIPHYVWEEITVEFVEALPKSRGIDTVLKVVDTLSNYVHFLRSKHPFAGIVHLHGFPSITVSDKDKIFMSNFWQELFVCRGQLYCEVQPITLKLTDKPILLTRHWKPTYVL